MTHERRLQLQEDPDSQKWEWRLQRWGWWLWLAVIAAGLAGLIGRGPLSARRVSSADHQLTIKFNRFEHVRAPTRLEVLIRPQPSGNDVQISLSREFWGGIEVHRIQPEPLSSVASSEGVTLTFPIQPDASEVSLLLYFEFEVSGNFSAKVKSHGHTLAWSQFVYP